MSDFGVLSAVKKKLGEDPQLDRVFLTVPPKAQLPYTHIEPEELWSCLTPGGMKGIIKIKVAIFSESLNPQELLQLSERVRWRLEGVKLDLGPASSGVVKITSVVVESPKPGQPRVAYQFYTILVRS